MHLGAAFIAGSVLADLRFAVRSLAKSPGFSAAVVLTLALGIGSASAIFSVVDRVLFRPLPFPAPDQLAVIGYQSKQFDFLEGVEPIELAAYRERAHSFSSFAALRSMTVNMVAQGQPMGVHLGRVPVDYFATFGTLPLLGRTFVPGEDRAGSEHVAVLGHQLWQERFGGDPAVLGREVLLAGESCQIVGVLAPDVQVTLLRRAEIYQPLVLRVDPAQPVGPDYMWVIGRLRPGVTAEQAQAELATFTFDVPARWSGYFSDHLPRLQLLADRQRSGSRDSQWTLLAAVGFLYAIAAANAANLLLARIHGRRRELCVRLALGSSRVQLVRLVVVESLAVTFAAGALGILVARWLFPALPWLGGSGMQSLGSMAVDLRAVAFTMGLSVLTGLLVAVPPVWRITRMDTAAGLKEGGQAVGETRSLRRLRGALVVLEAALAVVLLIGAGLMVRSVQRLQRVDRGIDPTNKAAVYLSIPEGAHEGVDARLNLYLQIEEKLRGVPGVQGVAVATVVPLSNASTMINLKKDDGTEFFASWNAVTPGYRGMIGLPMVKGQWFDDARPGDAPVVVLSETMARELYGDGDPIGRNFSLGHMRDAPPWRVVGVARDIRENVRQNSPPAFYFPNWQMPQALRGGVMVLLRLAKPVDVGMNDAVRRAIYGIDPIFATMPLRPLSENVEAQSSRERYSLSVLRVLSTLALGIAVLGLFAVMAYSVAQRMGEFGVRIALGAMPRQLFQLVLKRGVALAGLGVLIGSVVAWALTRFLQSLLYETNGFDPLVNATVALLLFAAAGLGCWLPARRAVRANVANLLRSE